jgi:hypothetical protein
MPIEWVTIGSYSTSYEANLVKSGLEAFGIDVNLVNEHAINANWVWSNLIGGVQVQVSEAETAAARELILAEPDTQQDEQDAWGETVGPCPKCGNSRTRYYLDKRGSFLTWLVVGFPVIPASSKRTCEDCGHKWKM